MKVNNELRRACYIARSHKTINLKSGSEFSCHSGNPHEEHAVLWTH